ncbi:hypothetical protein HDR58_00630 [bacterium]|nr:hypothetical protein [bacterium]
MIKDNKTNKLNKALSTEKEHHDRTIRELQKRKERENDRYKSTVQNIKSKQKDTLMTKQIGSNETFSAISTRLLIKKLDKLIEEVNS